MQIFSQVFWLPKAGNSIDEYEDAFWYQPSQIENGRCFKFAVADGATETSFSGLWATMLVNAFGYGYTTKSSIINVLPEIQKQWFEEVSVKPLPWYAEEKLRKGAFSSFLGLSINNNDSVIDTFIKWESIAIGDSCLFQVRDDNVLVCFPLKNSEEFNNRPLLLSSNIDNNIDLNKELMILNGLCKQDDSFYMMTDALACWFLQSYERGEKPWKILRDLDTSEEEKPFSELIEDYRKTKLIRNDDVTLLRIDIA